MEKQSTHARVDCRQGNACNGCKGSSITQGRTGWHACSSLDNCQVGAGRTPIHAQLKDTCKPVRIPRSQIGRAQCYSKKITTMCASHSFSTTMYSAHPFWQTPVPVSPGISSFISNSGPYWSTVYAVSPEVPTQGGQAVPAKWLGLRTACIEIREFPIRAETSQTTDKRITILNLEMHF